MVLRLLWTNSRASFSTFPYKTCDGRVDFSPYRHFDSPSRVNPVKTSLLTSPSGQGETIFLEHARAMWPTFVGSLDVCAKLSTYPSPKPTLTLSFFFSYRRSLMKVDLISWEGDLSTQDSFSRYKRGLSGDIGYYTVIESQTSVQNNTQAFHGFETNSDSC